MDVITYALLTKKIKNKSIKNIEIDENGNIVATLGDGTKEIIGEFPNSTLYWEDID